MALTGIELQELIEKVLIEELSNKEHRKLRNALCKKFLSNGLDNYKERVVLAAYILSDDPRKRKVYIDQVLDRWRKNYGKNN